MLISPANTFNTVNQGLLPAFIDNKIQGIDQKSIGM